MYRNAKKKKNPSMHFLHSNPPPMLWLDQYLHFKQDMGPNVLYSDDVWWQTQPGLETAFRSSHLRNLRTFLPLSINLLSSQTNRTYQCFPTIPPRSYSCF